MFIFFKQITLLSILLSLIQTIHPKPTHKAPDPAIDKVEESVHNGFQKSGKESGVVQGYDYIFNQDLSEEEASRLEPDALQAFSIPQNYTLITSRHSEAIKTLRYGDLIKIWHLASSGYLHTHNLKYYHPQSSQQYQVTIFNGNSRQDTDHKAVWWRVEGGTTNTPVDMNQPVFLVAVPGVNDDVAIPTNQMLHSHSFLQYKHPSPVREESIEKNRLKQEVSCFNGSEDVNNSWYISLSLDKEENQEEKSLRFGRRFRLLHIPSQQFLRAQPGITFDVRNNPQNSDMQGEVSCVQTKNGLDTLFKIALVARPISAVALLKENIQKIQASAVQAINTIISKSFDISPLKNMISTITPEIEADLKKLSSLSFNKAFAQTIKKYPSPSGLYNIYVLDDINPTREKSDKLLAHVGPELQAIGINPRDAQDYQMQQAVEYRTLFKIQVDEKNGEIGIEKVVSYDPGNLLGEKETNGLKLQHDSNYGKKGSDYEQTDNVRILRDINTVYFKNKNFKDFERWIPEQPKDNPEYFYLKNKASKEYLTLQSRERTASPTIKKMSAKIWRPTIVSGKKGSLFKIVPFQPQQRSNEMARPQQGSNGRGRSQQGSNEMARGSVSEEAETRSESTSPTDNTTDSQIDTAEPETEEESSQQ